VLFAFSTQRHMRVHAFIIGLVLFAAYGMGVTTDQLLHLLLAMTMVLVSEMFNSAIEQTIDLTVEGFDARAKTAKDMAAGAVLIAAAYSILVATLVFFTDGRLAAIFANLPFPPPRPKIGAIQIVIVGSIGLGLIIAWAKRVTRRGTLWRGGIISGHTALGFLIACSIAFVTHSLPVTCLALALALLVSQSRIQARIHSPTEVLIGGLLGAAVAVVLFLWPDVLP
jgi:diacylglycerol kinase (ATP)